jgi:hypothetical protein
MSEPSRPFYRSQDYPNCEQPRNGSRCGRAPAPGYNPLRLCAECLRAYRERSGSDVEVGADAVMVIDLTEARA